jgi:hypothetical protein
MKNTLIGIILGLIIAMWAFYIYTQKPNLEDKKISPVTPVQTLSPSKSEVSEESLIKEALAQKYNIASTEVSVIISKINSTQASGTVSTAGEGGWFLAVKDNGLWHIVADGNGTVSCETVLPYSFPISMVPECVDQNGDLKKL